MLEPGYRPYLGGDKQPATSGGGGCGFLGLWPRPRPYAGLSQPAASCSGVLSGLFGFISAGTRPYQTAPTLPPAPAPASLGPDRPTSGFGPLPAR